ncbi:MAG: hypothetical protein EBR18_03300 [Betaproteobacteria bacterium]|nr:hypothetical protein [Betaproteobacteria bacterium]
MSLVDSSGCAWPGPRHLRQVQHRQPVRCAALSLAAVVLVAGSGMAWAWNPFEAKKSPFDEVALTPGEWQQVQVKAGWANGYPDDLLFEVSSQLPGPMACHGASIQLTSGKRIDKAFSPRLYVPPGTTKQVGLRGISKGQMKDFTLACGCWKKPGDARCGNPARN